MIPICICEVICTQMLVMETMGKTGTEITKENRDFLEFATPVMSSRLILIISCSSLSMVPL